MYINRTFDRKGCVNIAKPFYDYVLMSAEMRGKIFSRVLSHVPRSQNEDQALFSRAFKLFLLKT